MTYYVCGPMSGIPHYNRPAFNWAVDRLLADGHKVTTPFEWSHQQDIEPKEDGSYHVPEEAARFDIDKVFECDSLYLLKGWELSRGARAEHALAVWLGKGIRYENE